jgi:hypothetical protein
MATKFTDPSGSDESCSVTADRSSGLSAGSPLQEASGTRRDLIAGCRDEIEIWADATQVRKDSSRVRIDETWMRKGEI